MKREEELVAEIAERLRNENIQFARDVAIGGVQADFVVLIPDDRKILIEVKAWDPFTGYRNRAAHLSGLYQDYLGVDRAFVVIDKLERSRVEQGVVTLDKLLPALKEAISRRIPASGTTKLISKEAKGHIFAAMPFAGLYDDVFLVAMTYAAEQNGLVCLRIDQHEYSGDIVAEIQNKIRTAEAVIADLSESNPNVLYETGFAHAIEKPTVHICSTQLKDLPFNVAHWNTIPYHTGQTYRLRDKLVSRLQSVLAVSHKG
ncbi:MAG: hypothetical protein JXA25_09480 [Anaerolineales bacterium]|nr:hypothetical protein [Anaerolineales bacterium]